MPDNIWSSTGSTDGNLAANWSLGRGPQSGDVLVFNATSVVDCILTVSITHGGIDQQAGYTGTLYGAVYNVTGDDGANVSFAGAGLNLGTGTWSLTNGDWTESVGTLTRGTSTLEFNETCGWAGTGHYYNINIIEGADVTKTGGSITARGATDIAGRLTISGSSFYSRSGWCILRSTGTLTGSGYVVALVSAFTHEGGTLSPSRLYLQRTPAITAGDYTGTTVQFYQYGTTEFGAGAYTFDSLVLSAFDATTDLTLDCSSNAVTSVTIEGDLTIDIDSTGDVVIDNSGQSVVWDIQGDVIDQRTGAGELIWTAGNASPEIIATGAADVEWDWAGAEIGEVEVSKSWGTLLTLGGPLNCESILGTSGGLAMNGQTLTTETADFGKGFTFNPAAADSLNGCTMAISGGLEFNGQALNATATWTLTVGGAALALGEGTVAFCDASGGTEIDATDGPWDDNGNNENWSFSTAAFHPWIHRRRRRFAGAR